MEGSFLKPQARGYKGGKIFIISAPSGAGKTTLCRALLERFKDLHYSVSHTTRHPRIGEKAGVDYFFVQQDDFQRGIENGKWSEWAEVHGYFYGTSAGYLEKTIRSGENVLLDIDVQGTRQILRNYPDCVTIFIRPPSFEVLKARLISRGTDSPGTIKKRLANAFEEMAGQDLYQHVVVNDNIERAVDELSRIIINCCRIENR
jgi:guanylate kinase